MVSWQTLILEKVTNLEIGRVIRGESGGKLEELHFQFKSNAYAIE